MKFIEIPQKKTTKLKKTQKVVEEKLPISLDVKISISDFIISPSDKENGNFLSLKIGPIENIPQSWKPLNDESVLDSNTFSKFY